MKDSMKKKLSVITLIFILIASAVLAGCKAEEVAEEEVAAPPPPPPSNPLTGELVEDGFDESALSRRVGAFVVENAPDARPQWGLDDESYSPDIVVQGEVEGGITRMLWLYADYKKMPDYIGPMRSARPPFIHFSRLFDSIFVHWGMSYSKGDYVGANKVFQWYDVDHVNQMELDDKEGLYDRDHTRYVSSEHTGIIHTDKLEPTFKNENIRTTPEEYSKLYFYEASQPVSETPATGISVIYSEQTDWETTDWTYNEEDGMYHSSSFENDFKRDNLLILYDETEYITKENYKGSGVGVTYCDYLFKGGRAQLFSRGTVKELKWQRKAGKLMLIDPDITVEDFEAKVAEIMEADPSKSRKKAAMEAVEAMGIVMAELPLKDEELEEAMQKFEAAKEAGELEEDAEYEPEMYIPQRLNKGKTWIGWVSSNNGGTVTVSSGSSESSDSSED